MLLDFVPALKDINWLLKILLFCQFWDCNSIFQLSVTYILTVENVFNNNNFKTQKNCI